MKKIIHLVLILSIVLMLSACGTNLSKIENSNKVSSLSTSSNLSMDIPSTNTDALSTDDAIEIAKKDLTVEDIKIITNYDTPSVEVVIFTEEPLIYKYDNVGDLLNKEIYRIEFNTTEDDTLGPITYYVDKMTGELYGLDYRY